MKKFSKILSVFLVLIMVLQLPIYAQAAQKVKSIFNSKSYTINSKFDDNEITQGIDVSYHDGTINWKKVKAAGVDFAIIRVGYRGYGSKGTLVEDTNFKINIKGALDAGIDAGVYFYSQALNTTEAKAEADFVLARIKDYDFDMPVVFDYEFADVSTGRLDSAWRNKKIDKAKMTNNTLAFCEAIENAGYEAMVYANKSFLNDNIDHNIIQEKYGIWLAHYTTNTDYSGDYQIWQYSDTGKIDGISTYVDCNFKVADYSRFEINNIPNKAYTGEAIEPKLTVSFEGKKLILNEDYTVSYKNNTKIGTATVTVKGIGEYSNITSKKTFKIVPVKTTNLRLASRGITSMKVKWNENETADGYKVQVLRNTGWQTAGTTTDTNFNVTGLTCASNYTFRVAAYKTIGSVKYYSAYSDTFVAATTPAKVSNLRSNARTSTSVTLVWNRQTGATRYLVYKYNPSQKKYTLIKEMKSSSSNSVKITGLKANTAYKFYVKSVKDAKEGKTLTGARSDIYTVYTRPVTPAIKSATSPSKKRIKVKWGKVSASGYQIMWSTTSNFSSNYKYQYVKSPSAVTKTIATAQSKKTYYVKVRAYKKLGGSNVYSLWSKTLKVKTK